MKKINNILIIGAGVMGTGISQVAAQSGYSVFLNDIEDSITQNSINTIFERWDKQLKKGKISEEEIIEYKKRIKGVSNIGDVAGEADLVIEAVYEIFDTKKEVFKLISKLCKEDTIIASNTSSISISKLANEVKKPERFIGLHFFSPAAIMKLLEIIPGNRTADDIVDAAYSFGKSLNKICIKPKDSAGFIVNRLLDPMLNDAVRMVEEGIGTIEDIDMGMRFGCGHPTGPLELIDMIGVDILYAVMKEMHEQTGNEHNAPSNLLGEMVKLGLLGKKTGKGFYVYNSDGTKNVNPFFERY